MISLKIDLRVGGRFRLRIPVAENEIFSVAGTYLEVKPLERLVYTSDWEKDGNGAEFAELEGNESQVTIEFREVENGTQLYLIHEKLPSLEVQGYHQEAWQIFLNNLTQFLEGKS